MPPQISFRDVVEQVVLKVLAGIVLLHTSYDIMGLFLTGYADENGRFFLALLPGILVTWIWYLRAYSRLGSRRDYARLEYLGFETNFRIGRWVIPLLVLGLLDGLVSREWSSAGIAFAIAAHVRLLHEGQVTEVRPAAGKE